jgi:hypothetical protein
MNIATKTNSSRKISWSDLPPKSVLLMVQSNGAKKPAAPPASSSARMRQVFVDGILMEMNEEMLIGLIRSGIFTVVYPGTNIPWDKTEDRHPNYPPDWFPPQV